MRRRSFLAGGALFSGIAKAAVTAPRIAGEGRENIPDVLVTDQTGMSHHFYRDLIRDKMVVINFFYAHCVGICPRMTSNLLKFQREMAKRMANRLGRDIFMYSVSLKPEEDTPKHLAAYAEMHGIKRDSGWLLLHAKRRDMELLRTRLGFRDSDPVLDADINEHTGIVRVGSDTTDKWTALPALGPVSQIVDALFWMDPNKS